MPILKTFCSICNPHSHCGINAQVENGELVGVEGIIIQSIIWRWW